MLPLVLLFVRTFPFPFPRHSRFRAPCVCAVVVCSSVQMCRFSSYFMLIRRHSVARICIHVARSLCVSSSAHNQQPEHAFEFNGECIFYSHTLTHLCSTFLPHEPQEMMEYVERKTKSSRFMQPIEKFQVNEDTVCSECEMFFAADSFSAVLLFETFSVVLKSSIMPSGHPFKVKRRKIRKI